MITIIYSGFAPGTDPETLSNIYDSGRVILMRKLGNSNIELIHTQILVVALTDIAQDNIEIRVENLPKRARGPLTIREISSALAGAVREFIPAKKVTVKFFEMPFYAESV